MGSFTYTRNEVIWLLSLTREAAIELDAAQRDSCAGLAESEDGVHGSGEDVGVPVIVRWHDVQQARSEAIRDKEGLAILQMRASGFSEEELARMTGRNRMSVRRQWRATVDDILQRLGTGDPEPEAVSTVNLCIRCGAYPRVRLSPVTVRVKGGSKEIQRGREASVCEHCLDPELNGRILRKQAAAA